MVRRARGRASVAPIEDGLSVSQFHLLDALASGAALSVSALAEAAGVTSPTATRMLATLERRQMVTRQQSAGDARVVEVRLTAIGVESVHAMRERLRAAQRKVYETLDSAERGQAARLLSRLSDAIREI